MDRLKNKIDLENEIEQYKAKVRFPGNKKPKPVC